MYQDSLSNRKHPRGLINVCGAPLGKRAWAGAGARTAREPAKSDSVSFWFCFHVSFMLLQSTTSDVWKATRGCKSSENPSEDLTWDQNSNFSYFQCDRRDKLPSAAVSPSVFWPSSVSTPCLLSPSLTPTRTRPLHAVRPSNWLSERNPVQK